jgi:hypothetical protein
MRKVERINVRWYDHVPADEGYEHLGPYSVIVAKYSVDDGSAFLSVKSFYSVPITSEKQRAEIEPILLKGMDEEAQWCAEHPPDD